MDVVEREWREACRSAGVAEAPAGKWWSVVKDKYGEPARHYHTLRHVRHMLSLCHAHKWLKHPSEVVLAIFFHDIVYDPQARDNEELSAAMFEEFADECLNESSVSRQRVKELILLTKQHTTSAHTGPSFGAEDVHYFLDMDMAILGEEPAMYRQYAASVRREYCHLSPSDYSSGRSKVLQNFLDSKRIFCTQMFHSRLEEQARSNIREEITELMRQQANS